MGFVLPASGARVDPPVRHDKKMGRCIMENPTYEQIAAAVYEPSAAVYEPPVLVEMGEFSTDTLGGNGPDFDGLTPAFVV